MSSHAMQRRIRERLVGVEDVGRGAVQDLAGGVRGRRRGRSARRHRHEVRSNDVDSSSSPPRPMRPRRRQPRIAPATRSRRPGGEAGRADDAGCGKQHECGTDRRRVLRHGGSDERGGEDHHEPCQRRRDRDERVPRDGVHEVEMRRSGATRSAAGSDAIPGSSGARLTACRHASARGSADARRSR